jgi:hypothetical protein
LNEVKDRIKMILKTIVDTDVVVREHMTGSIVCMTVERNISVIGHDETRTF